MEVSPNPFNPTTTIGFTVPAAAPVRLQVFDLRGRLVATLVDEELRAGQHEVIWTGSDASGREVPSGVYLSRLAAGGKVVHGRMALVR
jgi:flagellar hook assembly protein FlgD